MYIWIVVDFIKVYFDFTDGKKVICISQIAVSELRGHIVLLKKS